MAVRTTPSSGFMIKPVSGEPSLSQKSHHRTLLLSHDSPEGGQERGLKKKGGSADQKCLLAASLTVSVVKMIP